MPTEEASSDRARGYRAPRALGALSLALGLPALVAPRAVERLLGLLPDDDTDAILRGIGVQELGVGTALLLRPRPAFQWSRVAGDVAHLGLIARALAAGDGDRRRLVRTAGAVAAVTIADIAAGISVTRAAAGTVRTVRTAATINKPPQEVYARWRDVARLPEFMAHLEEVRIIDRRRSHWVAKAPAGTTVEWDAEIVEDIPGQVLAWRSSDGAAVQNAGTVRFATAPADQGTELLVEIEYRMPGGAAGAAVAKLFGEEPEQQLRDDVRRFKQVMETGEVVRSDAVPEGTHTRRQIQLAQRKGQPLDNGKR